MLRRIYGAVQTEEGWRIRNTDELEKFMVGEYIVKCRRAQKIKRWGRLINRMEKNKNSEEDYGMRCIGRPKNIWKNEVLNVLKKLKVNNWTYLVNLLKPSGNFTYDQV
jgi:hypothetical protein